MEVESILSRLASVKARGLNKWLACCPAHEDKTPSLSICKGDDDRILLHCHAQCAITDVLAAIGLELKDLFEDTYQHTKPGEAPHSTRRRSRHYLSAKDVYVILNHERLVVAIAAKRLADGYVLSESENAELLQAARRIEALGESLNV